MGFFPARKRVFLFLFLLASICLLLFTFIPSVQKTSFQSFHFQLVYLTESFNDLSFEALESFEKENTFYLEFLSSKYFFYSSYSSYFLKFTSKISFFLVLLNLLLNLPPPSFIS